MSTVQAISEESPSSWKYNPYIDKVSKRSPWGKAKKEIIVKNNLLGPGSYKNASKAATLTKSASAKFSFGKSNPPSAIELPAYYTKNFPGVGKYSDAYQLTSIGNIKKAGKKITKTGESKRYLDGIIKLAATLPGPGAYNLGPPPFEKNKS